jgi:hypothetical protein
VRCLQKLVSTQPAHGTCRPPAASGT